MERKYSVKRAALINASGKYSKIVIALLVNAILARILSPEDYGIVAVITVFSTFFTTFSDMGFGTAIIQNKNLSQEDIDNIFSCSVYISVALMIIFSCLSYPISLFYNNKVYISLGILLSISLLFNALNMVPNGILNCNKKFTSIAVRTVVVYVGSAIITIFLAYVGFRYYALAIQAILTSFFTFVWNISTTRPRFRKRFSKDSIYKVLNYSSYQFAFNIINYISRNLDQLLTGKFMGNAQLGYYNKAYTLMLYPVNNLTGVISPVLHPILSDYQNHLDLIYQKYMRVFRFLACIGIYVEGVCVLAAPELIRVMYGANWEKSIECFKYLSIAIITQMLNASTGAIFQAIGKTKLLFVTACINTSITVLAILSGVFIGKDIVILSICVAVAYVFHFIMAYFILIKFGFNFELKKFVREIVPHFIMLLSIIICVQVYPFNIENVIVSLVIKSTYVGVFFSICMYFSKEYKLIRALLKKK